MSLLGWHRPAARSEVRTALEALLHCKSQKRVTNGMESLAVGDFGGLLLGGGVDDLELRQRHCGYAFRVLEIVPENVPAFCGYVASYSEVL